MALPQGFVLEQQEATYNLPEGFQMEPPSADTRIPGQSVQAPAAQPTEVSTVERMFGLGSPIARFAKGAIVDPLLGVNQLLAQIPVFGQGVRQAASQNVRAYETATEQARAAQGSTGFDPYQLAGAVLSPANKLAGMTQTGGTGLLASAGRSAGTGATLAALQPVTAPDEQFAEKKLTQMGVGFVLGPVVEGSVKALSKVIDLAKGLSPAGRELAMKEYVDKLSGPARDDVIDALRNAKQLTTGSRPTAAEALSDIPSAVELMAAQKKLSSTPGVAGLFADRAAEQQAARLRNIQVIAQSPEQKAALTAERNLITGEMREAALNQADVAGPIFTNLEKDIANKYSSRINALQQAGRTETEAARQTVLANTYSPVPGYPRVPGRYTEMAQRVPEYTETSKVFKEIATQRQKEIDLKKFQLDSLEQNGFFPLKASEITDQLDSAIKGATKDEVKAILQETKDKILSKADENGILNSRDLYENVRQSINRDITGYAAKIGKPFMGGLPEAEAKTATNIKKFVDSALDKSSEGLWSKYIKSYTDYSSKLNRMEVGDYLAKKLNTPLEKEQAGAFAAAVENAAATIKSSTGLPRYKSLSEVLSKDEVSAVNNVLADLQRKSKMTELASKVSGLDKGTQDIAGEIPPLLSRTVSVIKTAIQHLQQGNQVDFNKKMSELLLDPAALAQFMSTGVKKGKINEFISGLMKGMDPNTRAAFQQSFVIPSVAEVAGQ